MPPPFEVADIIRAASKSFIEKNRSWLTILPLKDKANPEFIS
jgi:hypothetical protein